MNSEHYNFPTKIAVHLHVSHNYIIELTGQTRDTLIQEAFTSVLLSSVVEHQTFTDYYNTCTC